MLADDRHEQHPGFRDFVRPMHDFSYIKSKRTKFAFQPYRINVDHPGWKELRSRVSNGHTVFLDNTTLRNSLILMQGGLGDGESSNALLLPDLVTLLFAYAYFDNIIVLDQGLLDDEQSGLAAVFPELTVVHWSEVSDIRDPRGTSLLYEHHLALEAIQEEFFRWPSLHKGWTDAWSKIYRADVQPVNFRTDSEIDALLESPAGKLTEVWTQQKDTITQAIFRRIAYRRPRWADRLKTDERLLSALASYHTYRSILYFCLSDGFNWSYLPCGIRGVATALLPLRELAKNNANHPLNPQYKNLTLALARQAAARSPGIARGVEELRLELPILRLNPTAAALLRKLLEFKPAVRIGLDHPTWKIIAQEWREESSATRGQLRECTAALEQDPFDPKPFLRIARSLSLDKVGFEGVSSVASIVVGGAALLSTNPIAAKFGEKALVDGIIGSTKSAPGIWNYICTLRPRRRLQFLLRSREAAGTVLNAEELCSQVWGRGFSEVERQYLTEVQQSNPLYGI
jgi:hypothetical protein